MELLTRFFESPIGATLINFFNSNFFVASVGLCIFILYKIQQSDIRRDAAKSIFFEIVNAERNLKIISESLLIEQASLPENVYTMQIESWSRYKYLFIKSLDQHEWDAVNDFYRNCQLIDQAIAYNESFFQKNEEQTRASKYKVYTEYIKELLEKDAPNLEEFKTKKGIFDELFMEGIGDVAYYPIKPVNDAKLSFQKINPNLSLSSVGTKFKKIAKLK